MHQSNLSGFDDNLIVCVIWTESTFDPFAQNGDAVGLMQVTPIAIVDLQRLARRAPRRFTRDDVVVDPLLNVQAGTQHLKNIYDLYVHRDLEAALRRFGEGSQYPVAKIFDCEKCLNEMSTKCKDNPETCLEKIHK